MAHPRKSIITWLSRVAAGQYQEGTWGELLQMQKLINGWPLMSEFSSWNIEVRVLNHVTLSTQPQANRNSRRRYIMVSNSQAPCMFFLLLFSALLIIYNYSTKNHQSGRILAENLKNAGYKSEQDSSTATKWLVISRSNEMQFKLFQSKSMVS